MSLETSRLTTMIVQHPIHPLIESLLPTTAFAANSLIFQNMSTKCQRASGKLWQTFVDPTVGCCNRSLDSKLPYSCGVYADLCCRSLLKTSRFCACAADEGRARCVTGLGSGTNGAGARSRAVLTDLVLQRKQLKIESRRLVETKVKQLGWSKHMVQ